MLATSLTTRGLVHNRAAINGVKRCARGVVGRVTYLTVSISLLLVTPPSTCSVPRGGFKAGEQEAGNKFPSFFRARPLDTLNRWFTLKFQPLRTYPPCLLSLSIKNVRRLVLRRKNCFRKNYSSIVYETIIINDPRVCLKNLFRIISFNI